jgi:hypothetical protein
VAGAQTPALTTVKDTVYKSDGSLASGTVVITWQAFLDAGSKPVFGGSKTVPLTSGALAVMLVPNAGATPSGTSYNVRYYQSGGVFFEETWVVPASSPLATPGAPTVTPVGTTGATTYCYFISARNATGETLLGPATCITNGNATLDATNYNQVSWSSVSGATSYRVWRTGSSAAPTGTGSYLADTTASTSINDQESALSASTVPSVNDTDPKTLGQVRVTGVPSPSVVISSTQVSGTAIVSAPAGTQAITAPLTTGTPLQMKGRSGNSSNVLEVYDNAATPVLQTYAEPDGDLVSKRSVLPFATGGDLGATGTRWDVFAQQGDFNQALWSDVEVVSFSATPTFDASLANTFKMTLTGNVTSSALSSAKTGQIVSWLICQDSTGSRTFVWPSNVKGGGAISSGANTCSAQQFLYDGTNAYAAAEMKTGM